MVTVQLLFDGRFDAYFRAAAIGDGACIFAHVPKTAGSSLRGELAQRLQPDVNIEVDYTDATRLFRDKMDNAVRDFLAGPAATVRFASGHLMGRHVALMRAALSNARFVTFLRDPVDRVVSDYRYQRSPKHPPHPAFRDAYPTLEAYLGFKGDRDKMAQHLIAPTVYAGRDPAECVEYMLRTYDFIGVQDMYPISFRALTALIGTPAWPKLRENVNRDEEGEALSGDLVAAVRQANPIDVALYDAVFPRWRGIRDALARHLA